MLHVYATILKKLAMNERPILFSGPMVRAILDGTKTQTRRVVKPQPKGEVEFIRESYAGPGWYVAAKPHTDDYYVRCPYGVPGDRLWVRETWALPYKENWLEAKDDIVYRASPRDSSTPVKWVPSIFMKRWMSRILLEIEDVRVERVQDISEDDALDEGIDNYDDPARQVFADLWDSINAKSGFSWESNPWVWVIKFKTI